MTSGNAARLLMVVAVVAGLGSFAHGAAAAVILDSFGPGDTFDQAGFVLRANSTDPVDLDWAFEFTVSGGDYIVQTYELAVLLLAGDNAVEVLLMEDNGNIPGAVIDQVSIIGQIGGGSTIITGNSTTNPTLTDGTTYWVGASIPPDSGTESIIRWHLGLGGVSGNYARRDDFGPWTFQGAAENIAAVRLSGIQIGTCIPFFSEVEFEEFMAGQGKFLKGVETFEESNVLPDEAAAIPFPLDQNPNVNDNGFGFPDGLEQTNIRIWDNVTPGPNPPDLNPSGSPVGCAVSGVGYSGGNSIKIVNNIGQPSLDMVFLDQRKTAIGFKYSDFFEAGINDYHISVWNLNGDLIIDVDAPRVGPEPSKGFFGVWCEEPIGRINFFDPDEGFYGLDDIQLWVEMPQPTCLTFFDQTEFEEFMAGQGKFLKGVETFEESNILPDNAVAIPYPLDQNPNVDENGFGFPDGLEQTNIRIWDNVTPTPNPPDLNPSGRPDACAVVGVGFQNGNSKKIANNVSQSSMDIVFADEHKTAIGLKYSDFLGLGINDYHISVWNLSGGLIVDVDAPLVGPEPSKGFFGVWCEEPIGRINIFQPDVSYISVDDIQLWVELVSTPDVAVSSQLHLGMPVPNPATNRLSFDVNLPEPAHVQVRIFDVTGRLVRTPVDGPLSAGAHNFGLKALDSGGNALAGGVYYLRLVSGDIQETRKFIIMK